MPGSYDGDTGWDTLNIQELEVVGAGTAKSWKLWELMPIVYSRKRGRSRDRDGGRRGGDDRRGRSAPPPVPKS